MNFLKKSSEIYSLTSLVFKLHQYLSSVEEPRSLKNIHASSVTKQDEVSEFCPRYYSLYAANPLHFKKKIKSEHLDTSLNVTYEIGRRLQISVVNWFAAMGVAYGHWRCLMCNQLHSNQVRPIKCPCGCSVFTPEEMRFTSQYSGISGGVDLVLKLGKPKLTPIEIKTIDKDQFKDLVMPLAEHRLRTNLYLRLIAESTDPWASMVDTTEAKILYVSKGGYGCKQNETLKTLGLGETFSPFKEYTIARQDEDTQVDSDKARTAHLYRLGEAGMPVGICKTALSKRAKNCGFCKDCFSGEYPAGAVLVKK